MCTRFYIEPDLESALEPVRMTPLNVWMQEAFDKRVTIAGEVRPTDIATVIASNKRGVRSMFPMIWGFTHTVSQTSPSSSEPSQTSTPSISEEQEHYHFENDNRFSARDLYAVL